MSIIAVKGIPLKWTLKQTVSALVRTIGGQFEALNFTPTKNKNFKTCYLRLSEKLDPLQVIEKIKKMALSTGKLHSWVIENMPDIPLASKPVKVPERVLCALQISLDEPPQKVILQAHWEVLVEMQSKYTGLYNLSKKVGHKLLEDIAETVFQRLKHIMDEKPAVGEMCFKLTKTYRTRHPHFGDFQLILSTLHRIQDASGTTRLQIQESELAAVSVNPFAINNIPYNKVQAACTKYSEKVIKKIKEHLDGLTLKKGEEFTEEEIARNRVRTEMKKLSPYLPMIVNEVMSRHLIPQKMDVCKVRLYGEPQLPSKEQMSPLLRSHRASKIMRSYRMYNMVRFNVPPAQYTALMAMDGTVIGGSKIVIRPSDVELYKIPRSMLAMIKASFGVAHDESELQDSAYEDEDE